MTIEYFYITAGYILWLYVLICICVKLLADHASRGGERSRRKKIEIFFQPGQARRTSVRKFRRIQGYVNKSDTLFLFLCDCYCRNRAEYTPEEQRAFYVCIKSIIHQKIADITATDIPGRCLILSSMERCGVRSDKTQRFLTECGAGTELEMLWAASGQRDRKESLVR